MPTLRRDDKDAFIALLGGRPATPVQPIARPNTGAPSVGSSGRNPTVSGPPAQPVRLGPRPPETMGPVVGPGAGLRNQMAPMQQYTDAARRDLARTPIRFSATQQEPKHYYGAYYPTSEHIELNGNVDMWKGQGIQTLAHEYAHKQWDDQGWGDGREVVTDTMRLINDPRYPSVQAAWNDWIVSQPAYQNSWDPDELRARVAAFGGAGGGMPAWYRNKWFPNTYTVAPMGEGPTDMGHGYQTPYGFQPMYRFEDGSWGKW